MIYLEFVVSGGIYRVRNLVFYWVWFRRGRGCFA